LRSSLWKSHTGSCWAFPRFPDVITAWHSTLRCRCCPLLPQT
jgi:hypothetical protein